MIVKKLITVLGVCLFTILSPLIALPSHAFDYNRAWARIDSLNSQRLPKSALQEINALYQQAKADKDYVQSVKALLYKLKKIQEVEEETFIKVQEELQEEVQIAPFPYNALLHSMIAEQYWGFYQRNRYRYQGRSQTMTVAQEDMRTWSLDKIVSEVVNHYLQSLHQAKKLQLIEISRFEPILRGENAVSFNVRPTLYDFLAHRALDFFSSAKPAITLPAQDFQIDKKDYFAPAPDFIAMPLACTDSLSFPCQATGILQDLVAFHYHAGSKAALIDVDLRRLKYVREKTVLEQGDQLYKSALEKMRVRLYQHKASAEIDHALGEWYAQKADLYKPLVSDTFKWYRKKACEIWQDALDRFPESFGAKLAKSRLIEARNPEVTMSVEDCSVPDKPFLINVTYRNVERIWLRLVPTTYEEYREYSQKKSRTEMFNAYVKKKPASQWQAELKDDGDFQRHAKEVAAPASSAGLYMLLASSTEQFNRANGGVGQVLVTISHLGYISRNTTDKGMEFYVVDRETGQALAGVTVQTWYKEWDRKNRAYAMHSGKKYTSDKNGYVVLDDNKKSCMIELISGTDRLFPDRSFYPRKNKARESKQIQSTFFTDRAVYRPGQRVNFKAVVIENTGRHPEDKRVMEGLETTVRLFDVNNQNIAEKKVRTNDFGSYHGFFELPTGLLNGSFRIRDQWGQTTIQVEEYKRPTFEVTLDSLRGMYRLGDTLIVSGKSMALGGYPLDNASVSFRVVRKTIHPFPWLRHWFVPPEPDTEIHSGTVKTGSSGEFTLRFVAHADKSVPASSLPAFVFTVFVDVTDMNGETRSDEASVTIGYRSMTITNTVAEKIDKENPPLSFDIITRNLSGVPVAATGTYSVYRLQEPQRVLRPRLWDTPDILWENRSRFEQQFPHDAYGPELDSSRWERSEEIYAGTFDTKNKTTYALPKIETWNPGRYLIACSARDQYGREVKNLRYFTLYSSQKKEMPYALFNWFVPDTADLEPGDTAEVIIGSSALFVQVLYELQWRGSVIHREFLTVNNEQKVVSVPIEERYRGNVTAHFSYVKHNRVVQNTCILSVPWNNKDLTFEFASFRDKLQPGEQETWNITIRGPKKDQVVAEMVAGLYDASLDAFVEHQWSGIPFARYRSSQQWQKDELFNLDRFSLSGQWIEEYTAPRRHYYQLNWFGFSLYYHSPMRLSSLSYTKSGGGAPLPPTAKVLQKRGKLTSATFDFVEHSSNEISVYALATPDLQKERKKQSEIKSEPSAGIIPVRSNFSETAFFIPDLKTDSYGNITLSFTMPESITRWNLLGFAHTGDLKNQVLRRTLRTQKELMVVPNVPRFLREHDTITISARITNVIGERLDGEAELMLFNSASMTPVDTLFKNNDRTRPFRVEKGASDLVSWQIAVPHSLDAVTWRIVAKAGTFSDGEEAVVPILKNSMLVTETMPLPVRAQQTKSFTFKKLLNADSSQTLQHHKLTLEFTANPAWYALQALPYLMEYPYDCVEQSFSRFYANAVASHIVQSSPKIKKVFEQWENSESSNALLSNLEKNQDLKAMLLQETPWVMEAQNETERKKRVGVLFRIRRMSRELGKTLRTLEDAMLPVGAWPWFKGMNENRYITQHIVTGFAHLKALGVVSDRHRKRVEQMVARAIPYLDKAIQKDYENLQSSGADLEKNNLRYTQIHYLYARSYFQDIPVDSESVPAFEYYTRQAKKYWVDFNLYAQGLIALASERTEDHLKAVRIMASIKEHALYSQESGMYWKQSYGFRWYESPIETHALMVEAFDEIMNDTDAVDGLKTWLLKSKQTQDWGTTKATTDAVYALLLQGTDWLAETRLADISVGKHVVDPLKDSGAVVEAGTGYFKTSWEADQITPDMGTVTVHNNNPLVAWGALYWQYFEQLDKITPHKTPLQIVKKLFVERPTPRGPKLYPIEKENIAVGDRIKVRIELRVDRDMEFVHMKDMRASGFEPENVISRYKWQDGLGYYESTKDASTHFFMDNLSKGTYVFEYPLRVTHKGDFSNGITTIQCMYAPEFTSHSEGVRVSVE